MAYDDGDPAEGEPITSHEDELKRMFARWDKDLRDVWPRWREEARLCYDLVAGHQWPQEALKELEEQEIAPINWNRAQPLVDAVSGAQITNRYETKFFPRELGDVGVAELLTSAAEWAADEGDFEDEESDAFYDTLVCGLGWTEMRMDYEESPDGEIRKDRVDPLEMSADVGAKKRNLADAQYIKRVRPFSKDQFKQRFPEWKEKIGASSDPDDLVETSHGYADDDYAHEDEHDMDKKRQGDIYVTEWQWYEVDEFYRVIDPATQQETQLGEEDYERISQKFMQHGMDLDGVRSKRRIYYRAFCAGDQILDVEEIPDQGFTYHAITGKRDRNNGIWYGIVRAMVDPQRWANKWMTQILVILNKNAKGGILASSDAFADPRKAEEEWSLPDSIVWTKPGVALEGAIMNKPMPPYPQGLDRMIQMAISSIRDVTGINQELLGMADKNQPGIVESQRREAGYAMLAMFFDSLRKYRKISGRMLLKFIQNYISDGRLIRIVGNDGQAKYIPLVKDQTIGDYDLIVDESASGPNQKEKVWNMLVQMLPMLTKAPLPPNVWAELVRYSPLPETVSQKIIAAITAPPPPEAQQMQQMQQQLMIENAKAEIQKTQSEAQENMADAQAKMLEIPLKQAELQAGAQKHASDAQAAQAKMMASAADAQRKAREQELTAAKVELTEAQTAHQIVETAIAQLLALRETISGETNVSVNT